MQLLRPNEKANAILMAEGIKEVHAMIEPTLNLLLNSSTTGRSWAESYFPSQKPQVLVWNLPSPRIRLRIERVHGFFVPGSRRSMGPTVVEELGLAD